MKSLDRNPLSPSLKFVLFSLFLLLPAFLQAHGVSLADQATLENGGLWAFIIVGAKHMLTGYDHLLFLVGVIFYLNNFKDILKFITVFTIGHSITLIFATYQGITANEHLIDAVIALSFMVWIFGLIHGFGLSARLQAFDIGTEQFLAKIVCFNLGVELGQVLALIPIVFVLTRLKTASQYPLLYKAINCFLILAGIALFIFQMYGYFSSH